MIVCVCLYFFSPSTLFQMTEQCCTKGHSHGMTEQMPLGPCVSLLGLLLSSAMVAAGVQNSQHP